ncbi:DEAD/DEAH box helicase [Paenibacillus tarimensis]|uniref:DEAD/DEAH box helicase n=1 Tax=Paenibacillus tarimensis TaxID=416012 RepID=UPI001F1E801E|nr:DEAD/DEAH box helicase [Paenibacillus tarimensis]MCF2944717.1 DEAD/DEAH box helicase [Paenibacillus tarimensis]
MSFQLNESIMRRLCGRFAYEDGEYLYRASLVSVTRSEPGIRRYEAEVGGEDGGGRVELRLPEDGEITAVCSCPVFHPEDQYCKHIAAVLHAVYILEQSEGSTAEEEGALSQPDYTVLMNQVLELFDEGPQRMTATGSYYDNRTELAITFIISVFLSRDNRPMLGIGLMAGTDKLYTVKEVRKFLEQVDNRRAYRLSRSLVYDAELHSFMQEDHKVIQLLIDIAYMEQEKTVKAGRSSDLLPIPAAMWSELAPLLTAAVSVKLLQGGLLYEQDIITDGKLPLVFELDRSDRLKDGYRLVIRGLESIVLLEAYGLVQAKGCLVRMPARRIKRLSELVQLLSVSASRQLHMTAGQAGVFISKAMPGLAQIGEVQVADTVAGVLVQEPLRASLYLDRIKDRLLAGLEYRYGDVIFNPLDESTGSPAQERIFIREEEKERRISELLEQSAWMRTEGGYVLAGEEEEYHFLSQVLPELEKQVKVYATSAVKVRLFKGHVNPKVSISFDERTDWLEFKFDIDGIPEAEIRKIIRALQEKRRYYRLPDGALLPMENEQFQEILRLMNETGLHKVDWEGTSAKLPLTSGLHLDSYDRSRGAVSLNRSLRLLLEHIRNPDHLNFPVPQEMEAVLRDYQHFGYQWLKTLAHYRFGGILADEMGLGKTVQSIAYLASVLQEIRSSGQPALIVCPASLMYNWHQELSRFAPAVRAVIVDGSKTQREAALRNTFSADVFITSYPLLRRDAAAFAQIPFHTLFLDEAQAFKNYTTQTAQAVKGVQARHRFALTGTPIENRLEELWSIYSIVFPGLFPARKAFIELSGESVAKRIRPFLLRRLKSDVLKELPGKIESVQLSELLPEQKKLYAAYLAELRQETLKHLSSGSFQKQRIRILAGLTRLRQLCCHPALFVEGYSGKSAKFEQLLDMVRELRSSGRRVLVFSQFTEMLGLIARELGQQGVPFFYLDGGTGARERVELCARFNNGEKDVFLLSLKAGGTGLNLTGADTIILYDLWWNPAVEQQAADRAHRIGQTRVVQVIRMISEGTIEENMVRLQQRKMNLVDEVIRPNEGAASMLTEDDIRELLML